jgi:hypothetical protein
LLLLSCRPAETVPAAVLTLRSLTDSIPTSTMTSSNVWVGASAVPNGNGTTFELPRLLLLIRGNVSDPPRPAGTTLLNSIAAHCPQKKKNQNNKEEEEEER